MQLTKNIYILVGPKGSGKTYIGTLLSHHFQIPFLLVENTALRVKNGRNYKDIEYIEEVFKEIEKEVRECLLAENELIFEATGLTDAFDRMLLQLKKDFIVKLISIRTKPEICLSRIKTRDSSQQVKVSDKDIMAINAQSVEKEFSFAGEIDNNNIGNEEIIRAFETIIRGEERSSDESQTHI